MSCASRMTKLVKLIISVVCSDIRRLKLALGALLLAPATAAATSTAGKPMLRSAALAAALLVSPGCVNGEFAPDLAFELSLIHI